LFLSRQFYLACQEAELEQATYTQALVKYDDKDIDEDDDDLNEELDDEVIAEHSDVDREGGCGENTSMDLLDEYLTEFDDVPHEVCDNNYIWLFQCPENSPDQIPPGEFPRPILPYM